MPLWLKCFPYSFSISPVLSMDNSLLLCDFLCHNYSHSSKFGIGIKIVALIERKTVILQQKVRKVLLGWAQPCQESGNLSPLEEGAECCGPRGCGWDMAWLHRTEHIPPQALVLSRWSTPPSHPIYSKACLVAWLTRDE